jgi:Bacterial capsule synthesis protein PGA_cap
MKSLLSPVLIGAGLLAFAGPEVSKQEPRPLTAPFTLCAGGDVTLGTNLDPKWARFAADTLWKVYKRRPHPDSLATSLRPLFAGAQVVLVNVEGAIGTGPAPPKCRPRSKNCFAFRQPTAAAKALRRLSGSSGAVVGNIANNHSRDAGDDGRDVTVAHLAAAGVLVTGNDTIATPVPLPTGDTIGILGFYTDSATPDARDLDAVRRYVERAAAQYGTVIVTMHLGAEGPSAQRTRNAVERFLNGDRGNPVGFANAAFAGGATLVVGHGPNVLRAGEWRGDQLVLYSLGNLLTYGPFKLHDPTDRGAVACVTIDSARHVSAAELRSTMQRWPGVLARDASNRAWTLIDSLSALDFPRTGVAVDSAGRLVKRDTGSGTRDTRPQK